MAEECIVCASPLYFTRYKPHRAPINTIRGYTKNNLNGVVYHVCFRHLDYELPAPRVHRSVLRSPSLSPSPPPPTHTELLNTIQQLQARERQLLHEKQLIEQQCREVILARKQLLDQNKIFATQIQQLQQQQLHQLPSLPAVPAPPSSQQQQHLHLSMEQIEAYLNKIDPKERVKLIVNLCSKDQILFTIISELEKKQSETEGKRKHNVKYISMKDVSNNTERFILILPAPVTPYSSLVSLTTKAERRAIMLFVCTKLLAPELYIYNCKLSPQSTLALFPSKAQRNKSRALSKLIGFSYLASEYTITKFINQIWHGFNTKSGANRTNSGLVYYSKIDKSSIIQFIKFHLDSNNKYMCRKPSLRNCFLISGDQSSKWTSIGISFPGRKKANSRNNLIPICIIEGSDTYENLYLSCKDILVLIGNYDWSQHQITVNVSADIKFLCNMGGQLDANCTYPTPFCTWSTSQSSQTPCGARTYKQQLEWSYQYALSVEYELRLQEHKNQYGDESVKLPGVKEMIAGEINSRNIRCNTFNAEDYAEYPYILNQQLDLSNYKSTSFSASIGNTIGIPLLGKLMYDPHALIPPVLHIILGLGNQYCDLLKSYAKQYNLTVQIQEIIDSVKQYSHAGVGLSRIHDLNGNELHRLFSRTEEIMNLFRHKSSNSYTNTVIDNIFNIATSIHFFQSKLMSTKKLSVQDIEHIQQRVETFEQYWIHTKETEKANLTPKMHLLTKHLVDYINYNPYIGRFTECQMESFHIKVKSKVVLNKNCGHDSEELVNRVLRSLVVENCAQVQVCIDRPGDICLRCNLKLKNECECGNNCIRSNMIDIIAQSIVHTQTLEHSENTISSTRKDFINADRKDLDEINEDDVAHIKDNLDHELERSKLSDAQIDNEYKQSNAKYNNYLNSLQQFESDDDDEDEPTPTVTRPLSTDSKTFLSTQHRQSPMIVSPAVSSLAQGLRASSTLPLPTHARHTLAISPFLSFGSTSSTVSAPSQPSLGKTATATTVSSFVPSTQAISSNITPISSNITPIFQQHQRLEPSTTHQQTFTRPLLPIPPTITPQMPTIEQLQEPRQLSLQSMLQRLSEIQQQRNFYGLLLIIYTYTYMYVHCEA